MTAGWRGLPPPFFPSPDCTQAQRAELSIIIPGRLYLTNFRGAEDVDELQRIKCTHIAAVGAEFVDTGNNHAATALKVKFWTKDITDDEDQGASMGESLRAGAQFIKLALKKKKGCCVVHCAAGISRSATIVLAYLMLHDRKRGATLREAFAHVHGARPCIWPNEGFMGALIALEKALRKKTSITLDDYERWGDYDGPEEDESHIHRTKEARHQAAIEATTEANHYHQVHCNDPLPAVLQKRRTGGILARLRLLRLRKSPRGNARVSAASP